MKNRCHWRFPCPLKCNSLPEGFFSLISFPLEFQRILQDFSAVLKALLRRALCSHVQLWIYNLFFSDLSPYLTSPSLVCCPHKTEL